MISNFILSLFSTVIKILVNVGIIAIYSHSLSLVSFSYFALGLFISQIACVFIDAGINIEIMRFSRLENDETSYTRLAVSTIVRLALGSLVVVVAGIYVVSEEDQIQAMILSSALFSGILSSIIETYLINIKAKNNFKFEAVVTIVQALLLFSLSMSSFLGGLFVSVSIVLPKIIILYWLAVYEGRFSEYRTAFSRLSIYSYFARLKYYSIDSIFSNLSAQLDNLLVVSLLGRDVYGIYQPVSRLNNAGLGLAGTVGAFIIPLASTFDSAQKKWITMKTVFTVSGLIVCSGMLICAEYIVSHFFGAGFIKDINTIRILAAILFVRYMAAGSGSFLTLVGKQGKRAIINVVVTSFGFFFGYIYGVDVNHILLAVLISQGLLLVTYTIFGLIYLKRKKAS